MLPEKQVCPACGSDDMVMNGRFGAGGTWICRECGNADVALESEPGEDDDLEAEMPIKKSKLLIEESDEFESFGDSSTNLIKANRSKIVKPSKVGKIKSIKVGKSAKIVKGRKKK